MATVDSYSPTTPSVNDVAASASTSTTRTSPTVNMHTATMGSAQNQPFDMQPRKKHGYVGTVLGGPSFLIKSIDKPKANVEYNQIMRSNQMINFPRSVTFGNLTITLWNDVHSQAVALAWSNYNSHVWKNGPVYRDTALIKTLVVQELGVSGATKPVTYTFKNCSIESMDFDAGDDEDDSGVTFITIALKVEGISVSV